MNSQELENVILDLGLTAPRITLAHIENIIIKEDYYNFPGTTVTICLLTLANGFNVTGEAASVSLENFDISIGKQVSRDNAKNKIWALEGYNLKQQLFEDTL